MSSTSLGESTTRETFVTGSRGGSHAVDIRVTRDEASPDRASVILSVERSDTQWYAAYVNANGVVDSGDLNDAVSDYLTDVSAPLDSIR